MRDLTGIERSAMITPVRSPMHGVLNGIPRTTLHQLYLAGNSIRCPLPEFGILNNTKTPYTADWWMESYRLFLERTLTVINTNPAFHSGTVTESQDGVTFLPTTSRTGDYFEQSPYSAAYDDYFNAPNFSILPPNHPGVKIPGPYGGAYTANNETDVAYNYDFTTIDGTFNFSAEETRSGEYSFAADITRCLTWCSTIDFSISTGLWAASPTPQYASWIYRFDAILATTAGLPPHPGANDYWNFWDRHTGTIGAYLAAHSAIPVDNAIYPAPGAQAPVLYDLSHFENNVIPVCQASLNAAAAASPGTVNSMFFHKAQIKFSFATPYIIFEAGTPAGNALNSSGTLIKFISSGTATPGAIIDVPMPASAGLMPFISNGQAISNFQTLIWVGASWSDFTSMVWPLATEIAAW